MNTAVVDAHRFDRERHEWYVEPHWCSERLFAVEQFEGAVWDPCCGFGRIPLSAVKAGHTAVGTDIRDRGYVDFAGKLDFLDGGNAYPGRDVAGRRDQEVQVWHKGPPA